ncbi:aquaporin [Deinococcus radiophilus]|uniref:aquaporin n=1 Tax=Deinococcus radiophilus TaxID=32062 RepID=UPI0036218315
MVAIGMSFGALHGYAINPARDFGPRLMTLLAGFQNTGFGELRVWTVPIIGPIVGSVLGALIYDYAIGKPLQRAHLASQQAQQGMDTTPTAGPQ